MGSKVSTFSYKRLKSQDSEEGGIEGHVHSKGEEQASDGSATDESQASTWQAVANMSSFVQGVGSLALPYAVMKGGIVTIIGFPLFALLHWYTGIVMVSCMYDQDESEEHDELFDEDNTLADNKTQTATTKKLRVRNLYSDLGKVLWPRHGSLLLDAFQSLDLLILAVSYFISCGSLMAHAFPKAGLTEAAWASIVAALVLPSTFLKDLACVAWQSLLSITSLLTMVGTLIWYTAAYSPSVHLKDVLFWDPEGSLAALGLVISSYCVYSILIPVEESMADRSKFRPALGISLLLAAVFKMVFSVCGFLAFSRETDEVIGNNFPLGTPRTIVSVVYVTYVVFCYTLVVYPVFQSLDDSRLASAITSCVPPFIWTAITRFVIVFATLLVAFAIPHFALLTAFVGSIALPFLEYMVPCIVHLKLKCAKLSPLQIAADVTIIVMGVLATIFGVYFSGKALVVAMTTVTPQ